MIKDKSEDLMFSIITKLPERFIPSSLMQWITNYIDKRTQELQQEIIRQQWQKVYLEKVVSEIHDRQHDTNKAPQED
ncbi:MAG: hypothetical protein SOY73_00025 [Blautia sp.]|nr:hypothetical protein [Blautia sp.]MDY3997500.1 hypothetical protein [Blautia sp.]